MNEIPTFPAGDAVGQPDPEEQHPVVPWLTEARRAYFYRVIGALAIVAGVAGWVSQEMAVALLGLAGAVIGNGLAVRFTSTK